MKVKVDKSSKKPTSSPAEGNMLIFGDNIKALRTLLYEYDLKNKVDLVYIDPPFATNSYFTIGEKRASAVSRSMKDPVAYSDKIVGSEFLDFLRDRLILLHELMSPKSSIYLHIDYKIGHYVKVLMDEVFGTSNFRNDITRIKCNPKNFDRKAYGNIKDMILFYTKTDDYVWNNPREALSEKDKNRLFKKIGKDGRRYTTIPLHAPGKTENGATGSEWKGIKPPEGRHWRSAPAALDELDKQGLIEWSKNGVPRKKIYEDEKIDKKVQDIWEFKDPQYPKYPTEKNLDLLKFIVKASSNEDDLVLDCFSGSGTTLIATEELGRKWIGIDNSQHAIKTTKERLDNIKPNLFSKPDYQYQVIE